MLCHVYVMLCHLCYVMSCYVMLCHVMSHLCYVMLGDTTIVLRLLINLEAKITYSGVGEKATRLS
jgi:hypothetical protein